MDCGGRLLEGREEGGPPGAPYLDGSPGIGGGGGALLGVGKLSIKEY